MFAVEAKLDPPGTRGTTIWNPPGSLILGGDTDAYEDVIKPKSLDNAIILNSSIDLKSPQRKFRF